MTTVAGLKRAAARARTPPRNQGAAAIPTTPRTAPTCCVEITAKALSAVPSFSIWTTLWVYGHLWADDNDRIRATMASAWTPVSVALSRGRRPRRLTRRYTFPVAFLFTSQGEFAVFVES